MVPMVRDKLTPWTFDDLHGLPDDGWRYEIVDGSLVMTPPPGMWHEVLVHRISGLLRRHLPAQYEIIGSAGINLHPSYRLPDLGVIHRESIDKDKRLLLPADYALVVEIVSPGSESTDRVLKPAQYAAAGIPNYWRVEQHPHTSLTVYELLDHDGPYVETGAWAVGQTARVHEPFDIEIDLTALDR